ncbi:hypothetical protein WMY93_034030 [Mugilogobius chulae]|uniref:Uncharacterized protein n=1 Tax=Mugilogobius chulae TaxID=88201 RepID=A0AAW0MFI9_9GOBI
MVYGRNFAGLNPLTLQMSFGKRNRTLCYLSLPKANSDIVSKMPCFFSVDCGRSRAGLNSLTPGHVQGRAADCFQPVEEAAVVVVLVVVVDGFFVFHIGVPFCSILGSDCLECFHKA